MANVHGSIHKAAGLGCPLLFSTEASFRIDWGYSFADSDDLSYTGQGHHGAKNLLWDGDSVAVGHLTNRRGVEPLIWSISELEEERIKGNFPNIQLCWQASYDVAPTLFILHIMRLKKSQRPCLRLDETSHETPYAGTGDIVKIRYQFANYDSILTPLLSWFSSASLTVVANIHDFALHSLFTAKIKREDSSAPYSRCQYLLH